MDVDDEDDELLYEMDIVLAKGLQGQLNLFQYPVSTGSNQERSNEYVAAKIKPNSKKIELEIVMDTESPNYDKSKGELIAVNVDGAPSTSSMLNVPMFESNCMDKRILLSSTMPLDAQRLVAGVVQNNKLHLTAISSVQKLRPGFKYIDKTETRAKETAKAKANDGDSSQDEMEDAKAVTVRFKGAESDLSKALREKSYASFEKKIAEENWVPTSFHHMHDSYAERERLRLYHTPIKPEPGLYDSMPYSSHEAPQDQLSVPEYRELIVPNHTQMDEGLNSASDEFKYVAQNQSNGDLSNKVQRIMQSVKIIKFNQMLSLLPTNTDMAALVQALPVYGSLVQGLWIVKSEEIYPPKTLSPVSGIASESLNRARDYILYRFTKSKYLSRNEISDIVKIPSEDILVLLSDIGYLRKDKGWRLRFSKDKEFMKKFPQQSERQKLLWASKYNQLARHFVFTDDNKPNESSYSTSEDETSNYRNHFYAKSPPEKRKPVVKKEKMRKIKSSPNKGANKINHSNENKSNVKKVKVKKEKIEHDDPMMLNSANNQIGFEDIKPFVTLNHNAVQNKIKLENNLLPPALEIQLPPSMNHTINVANVNSTLAEISSEMAKVSPNHIPPYFMSPNGGNSENNINNNNNCMETS